MFKRIDSKWFLVFLVLLLGIGLAVPVLADYLGPNRTVTTYSWERSRCEYEARHPSEVYGCVLTLYYPPNSCPALSPATNYGYFNTSQCPTWTHNCAANQCSINLTGQSIDGCSDGQTGCRNTAHTTTNPPATISGGISCSQTGGNGWCTGTASLSLSAAEPLSGQSITLLEGTRNGVSFACPGASCSVPLLQGQNDFTYWALSTWGDSSLMGSASGKLDSQPPQIFGSLDGIPGDNGWYVSDVTLSASATDPTPGSGLAAFSASVDGSVVSLPAVIGAGSHSVLLQAADNAGLTASQSLTVQIDTGMPSVNLSAGASFCPGCGQTLPVSFSVSDAGSGIDSWMLSADGAPLTSGNSADSQSYDWNGSGLGAGSHTLELQAVDLAGNTAAASLSVSILLPTATPVPPTATQPPQGGGGSPGGNSAGGAPGGEPVAPGNAPAESSMTETPAPTQTRQSILTFFGLPSATPEVSSAPSSPAGPGGEPEPADEFDPLNNVAWGATAAGMIGAATYLAYEATRKRKEEEEQERAAAELANANAGAREKGFKDYADQLEWERKAEADRIFLALLAEEKKLKQSTPTTPDVDRNSSFDVGEIIPKQTSSWPNQQSEKDETTSDKSSGNKTSKNNNKKSVAPDKETESSTQSAQEKQGTGKSDKGYSTRNATGSPVVSSSKNDNQLVNAVSPNAGTDIWDWFKQTISALSASVKISAENNAITLVKTYESIIDYAFAYHGPKINPPSGINGILWSQPPVVDILTDPAAYYLAQWQNQFRATSDNDCVTTSGIMAMGVMNDTAQSISGSNYDMKQIDIKKFTEALDLPENKPYWARYRIPSPLGFMLPNPQLQNMLRDYAQIIEQTYKVSVDIKFSSGNDVDDLISNLQDGKITIIHIIYPADAVTTQSSHARINLPGLIGGGPHTVFLVGYDGATQEFLLLDPGQPYDRLDPDHTPPAITRVPFDEFVNDWGRGSLIYPGFSMTTISVESAPFSPSPSPHPTPQPPAPTSTPEP